MNAIRSHLLLTCVLALLGASAFAQTTVTITATDAVAAETLSGQSANPGSMRIRRTGSTTSPLTVWVTVSGVAVQLEDYTFGSFIGTSVVIPAGSSTLDIAVNPIDDFFTEGTEDVRIRIEDKTASGGAVPYVVGNPERATVNVADNEDALAPPRAIITVDTVDPNATETAAATDPAVFRITRTNNLAPALNILYTLGGTAVSGVDFAALPATITMPAGAASVDVTIAPIDDLLVEDPVTLTFTLRPTDVVGTPSPAEAYVLGPFTTAGATIVSEDLPPPPTVAITSPGANASVTQNDSLTVNFTASAVDGYITSYTVLGGSGAAGTTGLPASTPAGTPFNGTATITFTGTATQQSITVRVTDSLGTTGTSAAIPVTVIPLPLPTVTVTSPGNWATVAATQPTTVNFTASAVDGYIVSYQVLGGSGAAGTTGLPASTPAGTPFNGTASVIFSTPNPAYNYMQSFSVRVTNNHGISSTSAYVGVMVAPNLPIINIYALDAEGAEAAAGAPNVASFRVTHTHPASAPVSFLFAMGGTARDGIDYTLSSTLGTVAAGAFGRWFTFAPGATEAIIAVNPIDDLLIENTESVAMSLYTPPFIGFNEGTVSPFDWQSAFGFLYGPSSGASVNILDNDTAPPPFPVITIAASDPVGRETVDDSDQAIFTVTRTSGPTDVPLTVNYALTIPPKQTIYVTEPRPVMAQNGVDFPLLTGAVTIPAGATSTDIAIVPTYDVLTEVTELLQITLRPSVSAWPAAGSYEIDDHHSIADVNLLDATLPPGLPTVFLRVTDALAYREDYTGRTASFSIERTGTLTNPLAVYFTIDGTATNGVDYVTIPSVVTIPAGSPGVSILIDPIPPATGTTETVSLALNAAPLVGGVPTYAIGSSIAMPRAGGIAIIDRPRILSSNLPAKRLAILRRKHHFILSLLGPAPVAGAAAAALAVPTIWTVEASTDLENWQDIGTTDPSGEDGDFVDVNAGDFTARFYRFRAPATAP